MHATACRQVTPKSKKVPVRSSRNPTNSHDQDSHQPGAHIRRTSSGAGIQRE